MNHIRKSFDLLDSLESVSGKNEKAAVLYEGADLEALQYIVYWTYSPQRWGITPEQSDVGHLGVATDEDTEKRYVEFSELLASLEARDLTGNEARQTVSRFLAMCSPVEAKWYFRVLCKDLRLGLGVTTINKVWDPAEFWGVEELPNYQVQLCKGRVISAPNEPNTEAFTRILNTGIHWAEPKYDGFRMQVTIQQGIGVARSRRGKTYDRCLGWLVEQLIDYGFDNCILDGEMMSDNWNKTSSLIRPDSVNRQWSDEELVELHKATFNVWDWVPLDAINESNVCPVPLSSRKSRLIGNALAVIKTEPWESYEEAGKINRLSYKKDYPGMPLTKNSKIVAHRICKTSDDLVAAFQKNLADGFEGCVLKKITGGYEFARVSHWIKIKQEEPDEGLIIGGKEGTGRNVGRLGAFTIRLKNNDIVNIGYGLTDEMREEFWTNLDDLIEREVWLEFRQQTDNSGMQAKTRFAKFIRLREDLAGTQIEG